MKNSEPSQKKQRYVPTNISLENFALSAFGYRYEITSNQNNIIIGTGFFKLSRKMMDEELINFLHQFTNGYYLSKEALVNIHIFQADS